MPSYANRFYDWIRHGSARSLDGTTETTGFGHLRGHKYCLLVTYRRSGRPVATPVWFGIDGGRLYVRTDADALKVVRIKRDPRVRVAPCTARGKPIGPFANGRGRVLVEGGAAARAEATLRSNYGLGRKLYRSTLSTPDAVYLELIPDEPRRT